MQGVVRLMLHILNNFHRFFALFAYQLTMGNHLPTLDTLRLQNSDGLAALVNQIGGEGAYREVGERILNFGLPGRVVAQWDREIFNSKYEVFDSGHEIEKSIRKEIIGDLLDHIQNDAAGVVLPMAAIPIAAADEGNADGNDDNGSGWEHALCREIGGRKRKSDGDDTHPTRASKGAPLPPASSTSSSSSGAAAAESTLFDSLPPFVTPGKSSSSSGASSSSGTSGRGRPRSKTGSNEPAAAPLSSASPSSDKKQMNEVTKHEKSPVEHKIHLNSFYPFFFKYFSFFIDLSVILTHNPIPSHTT